MSHRTRMRAAWAAVAVVLTGCTVGPDFEKPEDFLTPGWYQEERDGLKTSGAELVAWWEIFNDPQLNRLVEEAHRANNNLEIAAVRVLESRAQLGIEALGFEPEQEKHFLSAIKKPYGMILVTGPTGSGKTVSLYTAMNMLNEPDVNISTVEDPVEIQVPGINQVSMNVKTGLTFAEALRAFLRQDPDIVMVGEIRDLETAEIAVKAAQTGHLVLSTLHTNDAPQTLTRLANMGVPPFNIASSVLLIMAQRLARRLCPHCKTPDDVPREALLEEGFQEDELDGLVVHKPVGCDRCTKGYKGRVGIFQVMPVSEDMGRIIMEGGNSLQLSDQAATEGIATLRRSGLNKVKSGITSLEEINRVTKE